MTSLEICEGWGLGSGPSRPPAKKSTETARYFSNGSGGGQMCAISDMGAQESLDLSKWYI